MDQDLNQKMFQLYQIHILRLRLQQAIMQQEQAQDLLEQMATKTGILIVIQQVVFLHIYLVIIRVLEVFRDILINLKMYSQAVIGIAQHLEWVAVMVELVMVQLKCIRKLHILDGILQMFGK